MQALKATFRRFVGEGELLWLDFPQNCRKEIKNTVGLCTAPVECQIWPHSFVKYTYTLHFFLRKSRLFCQNGDGQSSLIILVMAFFAPSIYPWQIYLTSVTSSIRVTFFLLSGKLDFFNLFEENIFDFIVIQKAFISPSLYGNSIHPLSTLTP